MPDHFHGIIIINKKSPAIVVGAGSEPAPTTIAANDLAHPISANDLAHPISANDLAHPISANDLAHPISANDLAHPIVPVRHIPVPKQQPFTEIIRQFKTFSARRINEIRKTPGVSVWQRNYYESIIHGKGNLDKVRNYIFGNYLYLQYENL
jgi:hypothetical protein